MGKSSSKPKITTSGTNVEINTILEQHQELHENHEFKLWLILVLVAIQVIVLCYKELKLQSRRNALKAAKSVANIENV